MQKKQQQLARRLVLAAVRASSSLEELAAVQQRAHRERDLLTETARQSIQYAIESRRTELKADQQRQREQDVCQECGEVMDAAAIERDEDADFCTQCQKRSDRFEHEWRREQAIEAGMCMGIDAYNEMMGWD